MRKIEDLKPHPKNPNQHPERQIDLLAKIIKKTGWRSPIIVSRRSGFVTKGHGRLMAARRAGFSEVPVDEQDYLDDAEELADMIADNEIAELAEMDIDLRGSVLSDLESMDYPLELVSFADGLEPEEVFEGLVDEDEVPEPPEEPVAKLGDLWQLGDHRLLCADATSKTDVQRLLDGAEPSMMVTDPPYGVEYDPAWRSVALHQPNADRAEGKVVNDDQADWTPAWKLFKGDIAYVWHAGRYSPVVANSLAAVDLEVRYLVIWAKHQHTFGRGHYHHQHEPCWFVIRKDQSASWAGDRKQTTLWSIDKNRKSESGHGTQKPVECMARPIRNHNAKLIYDPFLGSGTTLIACEQLSRKCYGMEISPAYCDVIVKRWEDFTGKKAELIKS